MCSARLERTCAKSTSNLPADTPPFGINAKIFSHHADSATNECHAPFQGCYFIVFRSPGRCPGLPCGRPEDVKSERLLVTLCPPGADELALTTGFIAQRAAFFHLSGEK